MTTGPISFDWGQIHWLANAEIGNSAELSVARMVMKGGKTSDLHHHPNCEEAVYLVRGKLEHRIGNETFLQEPGSTVTVPRNTAHSASNIGSEEAEIIASYSTAARDFQPGRPD